MNKDTITTIAGLGTAVSAALLTAGVLVAGTPIFIGVSVVGAVSVAILGFFTNKKDKEKQDNGETYL